MKPGNFASAGKKFLLPVLVCLAVSIGACTDDDPVAIVPDPQAAVFIDVTPDSTIFQWSLSGPDDYLRAGQGDELLPGLEPGLYELTWAAVDTLTAALFVSGGFQSRLSQRLLPDGLRDLFLGISSGY